MESKILVSFFEGENLEFKEIMGKPKLLRRTSSLVQDAAESTKKVLMMDGHLGHLGLN